MLKMYSQNDGTDVLGSRQQNFLCCPAQPWWEEFLQNSLKIFSKDFTIQLGISMSFSKKKRITNLLFLSLSGILKISEGK